MRPFFTHRLRRSAALLLALSLLLSLLCMPVCAQATVSDSAVLDEAAPDTRTLEQLMDDLRAAYALDETNFSISYYNTVTGESYAWNDTCFMLAGSTYKLPLNLYYYQLEQAGELSPESSIGGTTLANAHYRSIVNFENEISHAMIDAIGSFPAYKQAMRKYFTMTDDEIDPVYYVDNHYCVRMMMEVLQYLYEHAADYPELLSYLLLACPDMYFKRDVTEYDIAHKYGSYSGYENDVGIIYASQPFLLAVYTCSVGGEAICAQLARELTDYTDRQYAAALAAAEQDTVQEAPAAEDASPAPADTAASLTMTPPTVHETPAPAASAASAPEAASPAPQPEASALDRLAAFLTGGQPLLWMVPLALLIAFGGGAGLRALLSGRGRWSRQREKYEQMFTPPAQNPSDTSASSESDAPDSN